MRAHTFRPPGEHPVQAFGFARPWPSSSLDDAPHDAVRDAAPRRVRSVSRRSFFTASPSATRGACPDRFCHRDHPRAPPCNTTSTSSGPRRPRPGANASLDDERLRGRAPSPTGCRPSPLPLARVCEPRNERASRTPPCRPCGPPVRRYRRSARQRVAGAEGPCRTAPPREGSSRRAEPEVPPGLPPLWRGDAPRSLALSSSAWEPARLCDPALAGSDDAGGSARGGLGSTLLSQRERPQRTEWQDVYERSCGSMCREQPRTNMDSPARLCKA